MARRWSAVWTGAFSVATASVLLSAGLPSLAQDSRDRDERALVSLEVRGLRSERGVVHAGLFDRREVFLREGQEAATCVAPVHHRVARCTLGDVPPGDYAIAFFHDEDGNGHFARDWIGLPSEGYGFSNDASPRLAPPSFEEAHFTVRGATRHVAHVRYGL